MHDGICFAQKGGYNWISNSVFLLFKSFNILNELVSRIICTYLRIRIGQSIFILMRVAHDILWGNVQ